MSGIIDTVGSKSGIVGSDVYPAGHILNVYGFYNRDAYSQTTDNFDFIDSGNIVFNGTKILMLANVSVTGMVSGQHNVGFRFFDDTTHLTGASGNGGNSWQDVVSTTGFDNGLDSFDLNGSFLYTHGQSLPYTTNIKIVIKNSTTSHVYKLNRPNDNDAGDNTVRTMAASSLTLFDIA